MSDIDFNNGFLCGLAVKGTADRGENKGHKCIELVQLENNVISISNDLKIEIATPISFIKEL